MTVFQSPAAVVTIRVLYWWTSGVMSPHICRGACSGFLLGRNLDASRAESVVPGCADVAPSSEMECSCSPAFAPSCSDTMSPLIRCIAAGVLSPFLPSQSPFTLFSFIYDSFHPFPIYQAFPRGVHSALALLAASFHFNSPFLFFVNWPLT